MNAHLSDAQRRGYFYNGLVFPVPVLSPQEIQNYRGQSDELELQLGGKPRTIDVRQMHLHFDWAFDLAVHPRILDAVQCVLGPDVLVWATELFVKHPHDATVSIGWHRDRPYMGFEGGATVSAWVALADSTPANGCMRAIPSPERCLAGTASVLGSAKRRATAVQVDEDQAIDVVLRAGEMSLHDADIVHGSPANHSDRKRIGLVIRYVTPECRPLEGRPPAVLARGKDREGHFELRSRPIEADARAALAGMRDSAARHLNSMLANLKTRSG